VSLDEDELIGVWSRGAGYYATFSDQLLIFNPDGTGRLEFRGVERDSVYRFLWRIVSPSILDLVGDSNFHFTGVPFSVAEKERPPGTGQWLQVCSSGYQCRGGAIWASSPATSRSGTEARAPISAALQAAYSFRILTQAAGMG
jgi:hypothetical protein